ncbi:MAG: hypothetical protein ACOYJ5_07585 [Acutalibacteraceae bacterium]|jgi:predicted protein tyrosine phosphatase
MKIEIHSIQSLKKRAHKPFAPDTALISIGDFGKELPLLEYKPAHILRMEFDDVTPSEIDYESSERYAFRLFSEEQANQIADFVYRYWESRGTLLCQCHYGQSRSAAVAAAIKEHFYHNGIEIFADEQERYCPNVYVFRLTLRALRNREAECGSLKKAG